jgi:hypothetical protein
VIVEPATVQSLKFIVGRLRELDRREVIAAGMTLDTLPERALGLSVMAFCAIDRYGLPQAAWGLCLPRKGVANGWAFGTEHWGRALPTLMRHIRRFWVPWVLDQGIHRIECSALAHRKDVERFLALIGARPEAVLQQWGVNGEDFVSYRWLADEFRAATHQTDDRHIAS